MKIIYDDRSGYSDEGIPVGNHSFEDVSSDSVRTPGARKPVKPVRRPAPTLRTPPQNVQQVNPGVIMPQPAVYSPVPYVQGGMQPTMPVQTYVQLTPEQMAALSQQYPQGYPVYAAPQQGYPVQGGYAPQPGYVQPQYVQYQPQVNPIPSQQTPMQADAAQMPLSAQGESGMKVLYQSPDFDKPERDADTVSPSYTESLLNIIEQDDVDLSEETLPPSQKKASPYGFRTEQSATGKSFEEDDVEMSVFELNSLAMKSQPTVKAVRQPTVRKQGLDEEELEQIIEDQDEDQAEESFAEEKKKPVAVSEIIRRAVLAISLAAIVIAAGMLINEYRLSKQNKDLMEEVSNLIIEEATTAETTTAPAVTDNKETTKKPVTTQKPTTTVPLTPAQQWEQIRRENPDVIFPANLQLKYAKLYAANQDFKGYLSIDGVGLNTPVVQSEGNDEDYLERNFYGEYTKYGCPFMTHLNNVEELDTNTIIFGHNMNDGTIFGKLKDYKYIDGFREAPVITFNTLYKDYKWKVIAAFISNAYEEDDNGYVFKYYFTNLSTEERYSAFLNELSQRSLYDTGVDVLPSDKILTLSTCSYEFENARFVVVARLVRAGESDEVDVSLATENPNPRYPQAYYDEYDEDNPYRDAYRWEIG